MNTKYGDKNPALGALYGGHLETIMARHDHALERAGATHAVVFSGNPRLAFLDDYHHPFKANPHFVGWVPLIALPFSYIVYTPGETPVLIYYQPHDYWHVVPGSPDGYWTSHLDVRVVHSIDEIAAHLPADRDKCIAIGEFNDETLTFGIERINPNTAMHILHFARGMKTEYELAVMRLAAERGALGHIAAEAAFRDGQSEFDIHRAYCTAVSHTDPELPYYSNGDQRFQELIQRMDAMELAIVDKVQAGVDYRDLHVGTHKMLAEVLVDAELASGNPDTLLETGVTSAFFPHGLGHLLGIQVHDVGGHQVNESGTIVDPPSGHPFLRLTRVLEEDMVLTVEPGMYVIDMLLENLRGTPAEGHVNWETVDWLRPYGGIRIEDDVRVMANGQENLTRDAFLRVS